MVADKKKFTGSISVGYHDHQERNFEVTIPPRKIVFRFFIKMEKHLYITMYTPKRS